MFQKDVYIRQKELKRSKNNKDYLKLELCYNDKRIFAYLWQNPKKLYKEIHFSHAAHVTGSLFHKNEREQLTITKLILYSDGSIQEKRIKIINEKVLHWSTSIIRSFTNPSYQNLAKQLLNKQFLLDISFYPAGKHLAFTKKGDLFNRTRDLVKMVKSLSYLDFDSELILLAIFGQAYGYINGYYFNNIFDYNDNARFLGIGQIAITETHQLIKESELNSDKQSHLKHLINLVFRPDQELVAYSKEGEILISIQRLLHNYSAIIKLESKEENKSRRWSNYNLSFKKHLFLSNEK